MTKLLNQFSYICLNRTLKVNIIFIYLILNDFLVNCTTLYYFIGRLKCCYISTSSKWWKISGYWFPQYRPIERLSCAIAAVESGVMVRFYGHSIENRQSHRSCTSIGSKYQQRKAIKRNTLETQPYYFRLGQGLKQFSTDSLCLKANIAESGHGGWRGNGGMICPDQFTNDKWHTETKTI